VACAGRCDGSFEAAGLIEEGASARAAGSV
jgi:hypothetical protein